MRVLITGPESSGTRYVTALLAAGGAETLHRSQPEGLDWIDLAAMLDDFDAIVVMIRGQLAQVRSQQTCGIEKDDESALVRRRKALARVAPIFGDPKVSVVTYESLGHPRERRYLVESLGLDWVAANSDASWEEGNAKHYWD